jgi:hypothetical protein
MPITDFGGVDKLLKRFKAASASYDMFRSIHQETYDFVAPQRETFRFYAPGQEKNRHVFDSTAVIGLEQFASRIKGSTLPSWKQWAKLEAGSIVPNGEEVEVNKALEEGTDILFSALNHSNFDTEVNPALVDLGIGTGAIIIDEGEFNSGDLFRFTNVPLSELYPEKPAFGRIRSGWRKQRVEVGQISQMWEGADIGEKLEKMIEADPNREEEILNGQLYNPGDKLYYNIVIHEASKKIIFDQSFESQRLIIFRWHVTPGEVYGRGPAMQSLPDIRTLNKIVEFDLQSLALSVGGVYTGVSDGIFNPNTVTLQPKTIIPVSSNNNSNPTLRALDVGGNQRDVDIKIAQLQDRINKSFFANPLGEITDPVRSATENMIRQQEMLKQAGASFGRIRSELVEPLIEACVDILRSLGRLPSLQIDGEKVTIKHSSPLAKAEDLEDFQNILSWAQANIGIVGPEVFMGTAKVESFPKITGKQLGIPAELIRSDEEVQALGEAAAAAAQQNLGGGGEQQSV